MTSNEEKKKKKKIFIFVCFLGFKKITSSKCKNRDEKLNHKEAVVQQKECQLPEISNEEDLNNVGVWLNVTSWRDHT